MVIVGNMPFNNREFKTLLHYSPGYPKSNGLVECNVQTIKLLLKKAHYEGKNVVMALLEFQNTPITGLDQCPA